MCARADHTYMHANIRALQIIDTAVDGSIQYIDRTHQHQSVHTSELAVNGRVRAAVRAHA